MATEHGNLTEMLISCIVNVILYSCSLRLLDMDWWREYLFELGYYNNKANYYKLGMGSGWKIIDDSLQNQLLFIIHIAPWICGGFGFAELLLGPCYL